MTFEATPTRRQLIGSAAGIVGAAMAVGVRAADVVAESLRVTDAATVLQPAERLVEPAELTFPVDATGGDLVMASGFRDPRRPSHNGIDIGGACSSSRGRDLIACADAVVNSMEQSSRPGKYITLRDQADNYYRYHHLDEFVEGMEVGDRVVAGDVIGAMGTTGNTAWAHLHFEVWRLSLNPRVGFPVDPLPLIPKPPGLTIGSVRCNG